MTMFGRLKNLWKERQLYDYKNPPRPKITPRRLALAGFLLLIWIALILGGFYFESNGGAANWPKPVSIPALVVYVLLGCRLPFSIMKILFGRTRWGIGTDHFS
jgi:hypothetical protein